MEQKRQAAFDWFAKFSVTPTQVLKVLDRKGVEDITIDDLITLQGIKTAIQDGDTTMEQVLAELEPKPPSEIVKPVNGEASKLDKLAETLKAKKGADHVGAGASAESMAAATEDAVGSAPAAAVATADPGGEGDRAPDRGDPAGAVGAQASEPLAGTLPQPQTMDPTALSRLRGEIATLKDQLGLSEREWEFVAAKHLRRGDGGVDSVGEAPEGPLMRLRGELGMLHNKKQMGKGKR
jgi:hypothetical protein